MSPGAPAGGLLAVHAHPDDETLATGGLLATWAAAGRPVTLVTCTRGERGEVIPPALASLEGDGPALAGHREAELAAAMRSLGVTDHGLLDGVPDADPGPGGDVAAGAAPGAARFEDSGMAWVGTGQAGAAAVVPDRAFVAVPVDAAARRLARVIRDRRPDVVVTYEPGGGYGHPDHVHAHRVTTRAVELAARPGPGGPPHAVAAVLWAAVPDAVLREARAALPRLPAAAEARAARPTLTLPDPHGPLPSLAVPPGSVDLRVDTTAVLDRVAGALHAHATQIGSVVVGAPSALPGGEAVAGVHALSDDVLAPLLTAEWYRLAPGAGAPAVTWPPSVRPVA